MENSAKINSGTLPVFFTPKAVRKAIAKLWKTVLSGQTIVQKASSLSNKIGQIIFDHPFTLFENPNLEPYDCPFDDQGMPTMLKTFIEADTVKNFILGKKMCCSCRMQVHWQ